MKFKRFIKQFIGDKAFYKMMFAVAIPIMIQSGVTNLVNLLDNVMVGRLGTEAMSGVSIVNQFIFIFNLLVFGAVSAAGIFSAQFYGNGDHKGVRNTFRIKFLICSVASVIAIILFILLDDTLIGMFLHKSDSTGDLAATLQYGKDYLYIILIGLVPYSLSNVYMSTLRETGDTLTPMIASSVAVVVNFIGNLLLIFGLLGFPELGVRGAAIATVLSRFAELGILAGVTHKNPGRYKWIVGAYKSMKVPMPLLKQVAVKGLPLALNETFWSLAMTFRNQCYSIRGLDVVAAQNITSTVANLFSVVYLAMGGAIGVILGNMLGANKIEDATGADKKLIAFSIASSAVMGLLLASFAPLFPNMFEVTAEAKHIATQMMIIFASMMPFFALANASYFTLRSGGKMLITVLMDSGFAWAVIIPPTAILAYFTNIPIFWLYFVSQSMDAVKGVVGAVLVKKINWAVNLTGDK